MADIAGTLAGRNYSAADVMKSLWNEGCPEELANTIATYMVGERKKVIRQQAIAKLTTSVPALIGGLGLTWWSMNAAIESGTGLVIGFTGLILYGAVNSARAAYFWFSGGEAL